MRHQVLLCLCLLLSWAPSAQAVTRYIDDAGTNNGTCTSSGSPCKTFPYAIPLLQPGDTLLLNNGTYTAGTHGDGTHVVSIDCASGANNGTSAQRITIKAAAERQAHLQGSGGQVFVMRNCAYWDIEGLYGSNVVVASGGAGDVFAFYDTQSLRIRRNLARQPNAYYNAAAMLLGIMTQSLVEENEVYDAFRHGIQQGTGASTPADENTIRRNYLHARGAECASLSGATTLGCENHRGDEGISLYPGKNAIIENNIVEDFELSYTIQCKNDCINNRYYGNIALNGGPFYATARADGRNNTLEQMPRDTLLEHNLAFQSENSPAFYYRAAKNTQLRNNSILNRASSSDTGITFDTYAPAQNVAGDGQPTGYATNTLLAGSSGQAVVVSGLTDWWMRWLMHFDQPIASSPPLTDTHYTTVLAADPLLGTCTVFIPAGSPAKGAGSGGSDIGATILYRYQNGALTTTPLWNPTTGAFPCGAIVTGVNDVAGSSCFDVHERLNVNFNGCNLPGGPPSHAQACFP